MSVVINVCEAGLWEARPQLPLSVTGLSGTALPVGAVLKEAARVSGFQFIVKLSVD